MTSKLTNDEEEFKACSKQNVKYDLCYPDSRNSTRLFDGIFLIRKDKPNITLELSEFVKLTDPLKSGKFHIFKPFPLPLWLFLQRNQSFISVLRKASSQVTIEIEGNSSVDTSDECEEVNDELFHTPDTSFSSVTE